MKKTIIFALLFVMIMGSAAALIGHLYPERVEAGDAAEFLVTIFNHDSHKARDLQARIYMPDFDIYDRSREFYVRSVDSARVRFLLDIPDDAEPDYYPVIVTLQNEEGVYEKRHSWVEVYK